MLIYIILYHIMYNDISIGWYCDVTNLTSPAGACAPGYWCEYGVDTIAPNNNNTGSGGLCPTGYQCPGETRLPISCPAGTYQVTQR
jgi:hypothetical protein